jgi:hypothetical protein
LSPWTALLESLHSAMIDELTERHPEPKPELGMPVRRATFEAIGDACDQVLVARAAFEEVPLGGTGLAMLALSPEARTLLNLDEKSLWNALLKRAGGEFLHRKIKPKLEAAQVIAVSAVLPSGVSQPQRVIWIPFKLGSAQLRLGVGI